MLSATTGNLRRLFSLGRPNSRVSVLEVRAVMRPSSHFFQIRVNILSFHFEHTSSEFYPSHTVNVVCSLKRRLVLLGLYIDVLLPLAFSITRLHITSNSLPSALASYCSPPEAPL